MHRTRTAVFVVFLLSISSVACGRAAAPGADDAHVERLERALHGLEYGLEALEILELGDLHERLAEVAQDVRGELRAARARGADDSAHRTERAIVRERYETLSMARHAMVEAERADAADLAERAMQAYKVMLEGRSDEEAREIRSRAPKRGEEVELVRFGAKLYAELGMGDRAEMLERRARELWPKETARRDQRAAGGEPDRERQAAEHRLETMRDGIPILVEVGRRDTAELLEYAIHARRLALEGRTDEEAMEIRRRTPDLPQLIEILQLCGDLWAKHGHERRAGNMHELAQHYRQIRERERAGESRPRGEAPVEQRLEQRLERLERAVEEIAGALRAMRERR